MIPVYIPSMARHDERLLKGPIPKCLEAGADVTLFVPPAEVARYLQALDDCGLQGVQVMGCSVAGIAATRLAIGQEANFRGQPRFIMMDDDVTFFVRRGEDTWKLRVAEAHEVKEMLEWVDDALHHYPHVGISTREGNNRYGLGSKSTLVELNTRTLRVLAYDTTVFLRMKHSRVAVMEDFDVNLQILEQGGSNAISGWFAQDQRMTNEAGGCSTYRSHQVHEQSAQELARLHPGFVRLRQKQNKTDAAGFGTRTEVTIYWKKAAKAGRNG